MDLRVRLGLLVGGLVLVGAFVLASPAANPNPGEVGDPTRTEATVTFVEPGEDGTVQLWPFTSRAASFDRATLPINVVVRGDAATVSGLLTKDRPAHRADGENGPDNESEWLETLPEHGPDEPGGVEWGQGHGANRYTYMRTADGGQWLAQTDQLRDGSYFGTQYHLRIYEPQTGDASWTAIQAHYEHWDWFRMRHTVDSTAGAQYHVERDLIARGLLGGISRERYGNGGAVDADGWVTVVDLGPRASPDAEADPGTRGSRPTRDAAVLGLPVLGVVLAAHSRLDPEAPGVLGRLTPSHLALFASTALLMPLVRAGGIGVEQALPGAPPWVVGPPFFLVLILGYPALALAFGRRLPAEDAFAAAVLGMGAGVLANYAYMGVTALPYDAIVQRVVLLFGLGLIAAGGTRWADRTLTRHRYRLVGLVVWFGAILKPLLGF